LYVVCCSPFGSVTMRSEVPSVLRFRFDLAPRIRILVALVGRSTPGGALLRLSSSALFFFVKGAPQSPHFPASQLAAGLRGVVPLRGLLPIFCSCSLWLSSVGAQDKFAILSPADCLVARQAAHFGPCFPWLVFFVRQQCGVQHRFSHRP
jgi:hypothetical protein